MLGKRPELILYGRRGREGQFLDQGNKRDDIVVIIDGFVVWAACQLVAHGFGALTFDASKDLCFDILAFLELF